MARKHECDGTLALAAFWISFAMAVTVAVLLITAMLAGWQPTRSQSPGRDHGESPSLSLPISPPAGFSLEVAT